MKEPANRIILVLVPLFIVTVMLILLLRALGTFSPAEAAQATLAAFFLGMSIVVVDAAVTLWKKDKAARKVLSPWPSDNSGFLFGVAGEHIAPGQLVIFNKLTRQVTVAMMPKKAAP